MTAPAFALPERQLVLDRYRPVRPLGSGGSGSVWLARDERTGLDVALKIVQRTGKAASRAEREAEAAARLRHERCLRAYDFGGDVGHVYIAYEYVHGRTLRDALRAGELRDRDAVEVAAQVLEGLAHAHSRGIVHRDVKPANILLEHGDHVSIRILDFGLAQFDEADTLTAVGDVPGTLAYISPERLLGAEATAASDVWGVGVLLWESLAGGHPFWGVPIGRLTTAIQEGAPPLEQQRPDLTARLLGSITRALHVDPRRRPPAAQLAADLREALRDTKPKRTRRRAKRRRSFVAKSHKLSPAAAGRARVSMPHVGVPTVALPTVSLRRPANEHLLAGGIAAVAAAAGASILPFYTPGLVAAIGLLAGALMVYAPRAGLAVALAAPVFPIGNFSSGAAVAYCLAALLALAVGWGDPRTGLAFLSGPLLAPLGAVALIPLVVQPVKGMVRRAIQAALALPAAALVAGLRDADLPLGDGAVPDLGLARSESASEVVRATTQVLADNPSIVVVSLGLAAAAAALPYARSRGPWGLAALGAGLLGVTLLGAPAAPALPLVLVPWALCVGLALKDGR